MSLASPRPHRSIARDRRPARGHWSELIAAAAVLVLLGGSVLLGGADALAGAVVGLGLVTLFLLAGRLPVLVEPLVGAGASFLLLGINYLFRVVLLLVALVALRDQTWLDQRVVGGVVIASALGWNVVVLRQHLRGAADAKPDAETTDETVVPSGSSAR